MLVILSSFGANPIFFFSNFYDLWDIISHTAGLLLCVTMFMIKYNQPITPDDVKNKLQPMIILL